MSATWTTVATAELEDADLVLQQRGDDFLIWYDGRVLMNSFSRGSEEQLAQLALEPVLHLVPFAGQVSPCRPSCSAGPGSADQRASVFESRRSCSLSLCRTP